MARLVRRVRLEEAIDGGAGGEDLRRRGGGNNGGSNVLGFGERIDSIRVREHGEGMRWEVQSSEELGF